MECFGLIMLMQLPTSGLVLSLDFSLLTFNSSSWFNGPPDANLVNWRPRLRTFIQTCQSSTSSNILYPMIKGTSPRRITMFHQHVHPLPFIRAIYRRRLHIYRRRINSISTGSTGRKIKVKVVKSSTSFQTDDGHNSVCISFLFFCWRQSLTKPPKHGNENPTRTEWFKML